MDRRTFVRLLTAVPLVTPRDRHDDSSACAWSAGIGPAATPGMPGRYPGPVVAVRLGAGARCRDHAQTAADVVREMMARGMCALTRTRAARRRLAAVLRPCRRGWHQGQLRRPSPRRLGPRDRCRNGTSVDERRHTCRADIRLRALPAAARGRELRTAPAARRPDRRRRAGERLLRQQRLRSSHLCRGRSVREEDTRSNMMRLITRRLTKIINIPNVKDHGATGATGCLKNIAYGSFSNVARTHYHGRSHTYSFVGTLAVGRAAEVSHGPADHGRAPRCVARRSLRA